MFAILGVVGILVLSAACGRGEPPLEGRGDHATSWGNPLQPLITWVLSSLNGSPIIEDTFISLTIYETSVGGGDGCNSYGIQDAPPTVFAPSDTDPDGSYMEGKFTAQEIVNTLALCDWVEGVMEQADAYYTALREGKSFRIQDNQLEIFDGEGQATLVFVRQPPLPGSQPKLSKTQWSLMGDDGVGILGFVDDEVVLMAGECRDYIGTYSTYDRLLLFSMLPPLVSYEQCPWQDVIYSVVDAEQYSVTDQEGSGKLMFGFSSGKRLVLEPLSAVVLDTEKDEWLLTNIVEWNSDPDGRDQSWSLIGTVFPVSPVTISFQEDHIVGSAGCNSYQASLNNDSDAIAIGPPSTTSGSTCGQLTNAEEVMSQEERYLSLLPQMTRMGTYGDRLILSTATGAYLIFEAG